MLQGAAEVARRAGCLVLGGHSIDDAEPKFGMAVIGEVHPDRMFTNAGGAAGDMLVLTKPLGTGISPPRSSATHCSKRGMADAVHSMTTLNDGAARAAREAGISAATDVTGFGLIGPSHAHRERERARGRALVRRAPTCRRAGPGGPRLRAGRYAAEPRRGHQRHLGRPLTDADRAICADAQTSGGLLLAVPAENYDSLIVALRREGTPAATVGRLVAGERGAIRVRRADDPSLAGAAARAPVFEGCSGGLPLVDDPAGPPSVVPPTLAGVSVFPADNAWNTPVDTAPVDPASDALIASIGPTATFIRTSARTGMEAPSASPTWSSTRASPWCP